MPEPTAENNVLGAPKTPIEATGQAMSPEDTIAGLPLSPAKNKTATQRDNPVKGSNGSPFLENHLRVIGTRYEDEHDGHLSLPPLFRRSQTIPPTETASADIVQETPDHIPPGTFFSPPKTEFFTNHIDALTGQKGKLPPIPVPLAKTDEKPPTPKVRRYYPTDDDLRRLNRVMGGNGPIMQSPNNPEENNDPNQTT